MTSEELDAPAQAEDVAESVTTDDGVVHAMDVCPAAYTCPSDYSCGTWSSYTACTGTLGQCLPTTACRVCEIINGRPVCYNEGGQTKATSYRIQACQKPGVPTCYSYQLTHQTSNCGCEPI